MNLERFTRRISDSISRGDVSKRFKPKEKPLSTERLFNSDAEHRKELKKSYEDRIAEQEMPYRKELAEIWNKQLNDGINTTELRKYYPNGTDRPLWTEQHLQRMYAFRDNKSGAIQYAASPDQAVRLFRKTGIELPEGSLDDLKVKDKSKHGVTRLEINNQLVQNYQRVRNVTFYFEKKNQDIGTLTGRKGNKDKNMHWQFEEHSKLGTSHQPSDYNVFISGENTQASWQGQEPLPLYDDHDRPPSYEQSQLDERSNRHSSLEKLLRDPPPDSEQSPFNDSYEQSQQGKRPKRHSLEELLQLDSEQSLSNDSNTANPPGDSGEPNSAEELAEDDGKPNLAEQIRRAVGVLTENARNLEQNKSKFD
mgnify:CR=1 FL=1